MDKHETPPPYNFEQGPHAYGMSPPPPQAHPYPVTAPPPMAQPHVTTVNISTAPQYGGSCPVCHTGTFKTGFTLCGWLCCIFCFPCGILFCCCCMREKKCNHCGFSVS